MPFTLTEIEALFEQPFNDLLLQAQQAHRLHFDANAVQVSTLLSVKTGGCSEDCSYCSQSVRHKTAVENEKLMSASEVVALAKKAQENGASRFCMGAAWRGPKQKELSQVLEMVRGVKALGMETCTTLGMLRPGQADQLFEAGLDYYNHNLDTSPDFYDQIVSTHSYDDRLDTLDKVRNAGIKVCCGGIVGLGEERRHRAGLIAQLAAMDPVPESVPINLLVKIEGTPLAALKEDAGLDPIEFVRTIAVTRIALPRSMVRLSAGRNEMPESLQAMCFFAGANSIFYGDKLLTTSNPDTDKDRQLFEKLGIYPLPADKSSVAMKKQSA